MFLNVEDWEVCDLTVVRNELKESSTGAGRALASPSDP